MRDGDTGYRYPLARAARHRLTSWLPLADTFPSCRELSLSEQKLVNEKLPRLLAAIFSDDDASLREVDLPDADAFIGAAADAAVSGSVRDWLFNMGIGGWERLPSWRLITQISPLLESAKRLQEAGFGIPRIQFFKANSLAAFVNTLDEAKLAISSAGTLRFIGEYVADWYPALRFALELEEDSPHWLSCLIDEVLLPMSMSTPIDPDMERLSRGRSSTTKGMIYGLAHAFQLQHVIGNDVADRRLWKSRFDLRVPKAVVTFGGVAERLFTNVIRTALHSAPPDRFRRVVSARVVSRHCRKPAYMPTRDEILIERVPTLKEIRQQSAVPEIAADWKHLRKRHAFDLAIASSSGATPFARLAAAVQQAAGFAA